MGLYDSIANPRPQPDALRKALRNGFSLRVTHREFRALAYILRNSDLAFVSSVNVMSYSADRGLEWLCNHCHILCPDPACWKKGCSRQATAHNAPPHSRQAVTTRTLSW